MPAFTVLELFAGIGGCAVALAAADDRREVRVAAALDLNRPALAVYRHNLRHRTEVSNLAGSRPEALAAYGADLWWLSPPCQPYTRRGLQRDDEDPRAVPLLRLIDCLEAAAPRYLAIENVPEFEGSRSHRRLIAALDRAGYDRWQTVLCPSALGVPNRRRRFYLVAGRSGDGPLAPPPQPMPAEAGPPARPAAAVGDLLDPEANGGAPGGLELPADQLHRYRHALHLVDPADRGAVTACFTAAYGRSPVRSGSHLLTGGSLDRPTAARRFSPRELLRLLGFPRWYRLPHDLPRAAAWRLAGNSLSLPAVRRVLSAIPQLAHLR